MLYLTKKIKLNKERLKKCTCIDHDKVTKKFESDPSDLNKIRLNEIKEKLELFYEERVKGIIIRARAHWY